MKSLIGLVLAITVMFANTIEVKKGWQLIGVPQRVDIAQTFNNKSVEILWAYDADTQSWMGYSPDANISEKIAQTYTTPTTLLPYQAIWVLSSKDWSLEYTPKSVTTAQNSTITLKSGWNLISLPQDIIVSDALFGDALIWRYSETKEWSVNDANLSYPTLDAIKSSDGLWVKSDEDKVIEIDNDASKLHNFSTREAMLEYIRKMATMYNYYYGYYDVIALNDTEVLGLDGGIADEPQPSTTQEQTTTTTPAEDATTTNLQEEGVDEGDILKNDGTYIYSVDNSAQKIVVTSFEKIVKQDYKPITTIDLSGKNIVSIYLQKSRLVVISNEQRYYILAPKKADTADVASPDEGILPPQKEEGGVDVDIFDVSSIDNIKKLATYNISGNYQESRVVDAKLYLITQFMPQLTYEYPKIYVDTPCSSIDQTKISATCSGSTGGGGMPVEPQVVDEVSARVVQNDGCEYSSEYLLWNENRCYVYGYDKKGAFTYDYEHPNITSENLEPMLSANGTTQAKLLEPSRFYAPYKLNQAANITSISQFDLESGEYKSTSAFLGNTHTYYASLNALYLVSSEYPLYYNYIDYKEQQTIYKFALNDTIDYIAKGSVEGRTLNQFSMGESGEYLRIATTSGWSWWQGGETSNTLFVLKANNDQELHVEASLEGLGKEGESIKAVRFMGNRGFVVTFRQRDPLYTLDLSEPLAPKVAGELSIPGYSSYLHVVDDNRLLSIGRDADSEGRTLGLVVQLFDISDFNQPKLADKLSVGDSYTYSEAEYNARAFSYRASDLKFGLPYRSYTPSNSEYGEYFGIYQIEGYSIKSLHTLQSENSNWGNVGRGIIFDMNNTSYGALFKGSHMMCETIEKEKALWEDIS